MDTVEGAKSYGERRSEGGWRGGGVRVEHPPMPNTIQLIGESKGSYRIAYYPYLYSVCNNPEWEIQSLCPPDKQQHQRKTAF